MLTIFFDYLHLTFNLRNLQSLNISINALKFFNTCVFIKAKCHKETPINFFPPHYTVMYRVKQTFEAKSMVYWKFVNIM
jgi:hypothetical protein